MGFKFALGVIFLFAYLRCSQSMVSDKDAAIEVAYRAKQQYEEILENGGLERVRQAVSDETKFGHILEWIGAHGICLRRGRDLKGACYALSDFGEDVSREWMAHPYSSQMLRTEQWYEKLYNSIANTLQLESEGTAPLLLATGGHPQAESYDTGRIGLGDSRTFAKGNLRENSRQAGENLELDVIASLHNMVGTVAHVLQWIERAFEQQQQ